jgi:hypothetical protein
VICMPSSFSSSRSVRAFLSSVASLHRVWRRCLDAIVLVKPATVVQWHRHGFLLYWPWWSLPGRRPVDRQTRRLSREMRIANPLCGAPAYMASC